MTQTSVSTDAQQLNARYPLMEVPFVGFLLALSAGALNAWSLSNAGTFSTVQSGNVVSVGYWLIQGNWEKLMFPLFAVIAFGLGSAVCGIVMTAMLRKGKVYTPVVLVSGTVILVVLGICAITIVGAGSGNVATLNLSPENAVNAQWIAYALSFIAGAQGNAFHKNHGMLYGNVAVTFVVQMAFNFLVQSFFKKTGINGTSNLKWAGIFFLTLLGFAGGGALGFLVDQTITNGASIFLPAIIMLFLAIISTGRHFKNIDPTPGGIFA